MAQSEKVAQSEAVKLAEALKPSVSIDDNLDAVWESAETVEALKLVRAAGYLPDEFLYKTNLELNFNASSFVKRFYQAYLHQVRSSLCKQDSDLRTQIGTAIATGTGSLITALATALSVPVGAVMLVAPIAAILLERGIDAFCDMDG